MKTACFGGDYPRSKQQHDFRSQSCIAIASEILTIKMNPSSAKKVENDQDVPRKVRSRMPTEMTTPDFAKVSFDVLIIFKFGKLLKNVCFNSPRQFRFY